MHPKYNICQSCSLSSPLGGEVPGACQQLPRRPACASRVRIQLGIEALNHLGFSCEEQKRDASRKRTKLAVGKTHRTPNSVDKRTSSSACLIETAGPALASSPLLKGRGTLWLSHHVPPWRHSDLCAGRLCASSRPVLLSQLPQITPDYCSSNGGATQPPWMHSRR